jgi:stage IV sporulation protein FB
MVLCVLLAVLHTFYYTFTLSFVSIMLFLFIENRLEWKRRFYIFLRFLLQRYEGTHSVHHLETLHLPGSLTLIEVFSKFKREKKHTVVISDSNHIINRADETVLLHAYFYEKQHGQTLDNILK